MVQNEPQRPKISHNKPKQPTTKDTDSQIENMGYNEPQAAPKSHNDKKRT